MKIEASKYPVSSAARVGAVVIVLASVLAAVAVLANGIGIVGLSWRHGSLLTAVVCSYVWLVFAWVAVTGCVPRFFPLGSLNWPFRPPGT
ncbi:MAG: hypothetical protein EPO42_14615 [Gallionellaceae bacterium]|nr:MAG: hypothetical protein EPO42_14615 [Gallionellaceae bacterium]